MNRIRFKDEWNGLLLALQFFTIVPISKKVKINDFCLKRSIQYYPFIGAGFGAVLAFLLWLLHMVTPFSDVAAALFLLTLPIVMTGGLHLDGWMDCSDAYFSYRDRDKRLDIMKDPRVGSFAVLSLLFLLAWRFLFIFETVAAFTGTDYFFIMIIPVLSRIVMGSVLIFGTPAKNEGLAAYYKSALKNSDSYFYGVYIVLLVLLMVSIRPDTLYAVAGLLLAALFIGTLIHRFINRAFGGITGDMLGATLEGVETWLWMILWLFHVFVTV